MFNYEVHNHDTRVKNKIHIYTIKHNLANKCPPARPPARHPASPPAPTKPEVPGKFSKPLLVTLPIAVEVGGVVYTTLEDLQLTMDTNFRYCEIIKFTTQLLSCAFPLLMTSDEPQ